MDSPGAYPESPIEDEVVYPCKGCGEILEEGKAFELAGNRWHIDCFRCNTCGTLLDSDANLLLLGDGSLICNNCTYSCNHCGNKIEDLAILTGDQAFCANCFRCRNCKRKIENLRYARTSQGIFCMSCHESLMARRRKKSKKPPSIAPKVDKSLPALPPQDPPTSTFTPDLDTPSDVFSEPTTTDVSPRPPNPRRGDSSSNFRRDASPAADVSRRAVDNTTLPATTYGKEPIRSEPVDNGDDGILLPFALDPNPAPGPSPLGRPISRFNDRTLGAKSTGAVDVKSARDYFSRPTADHREKLKENGSREASKERRQTFQPQTQTQTQSPHIAFQEKGRQPSDTLVETLRKKKDPTNESPSAEPLSKSQHASPAPSSAAEPFKLQDVPKNKKAEAKRKDSDELASPQSQQQQRSVSHNTMSARLSRPLIEPTFTSSPPMGSQDSPDTSESSFSSSLVLERPARGDSLKATTLKPSASLSQSERRDRSPTTPTLSHPERTSSTTVATANLNAGLGITGPADSPSSRTLSDVPVLPARSGGRPPPPSTDTFTSPRAPPQPPTTQLHKPTESVSSAQSEASRDVPPGGLPRYSHQGDFSMDEDFARLLSSQEGREDKDGGVFRRVSNAVSKHGRSFSDRGSVTSRGHKKWPTNGSIDISSPTVASPDTKEEGANLRNELRRAQQRIAELEAEKNGLQESMHSAADIKQANTVLREKRNTMAVLDTQREMVIRELEIMTEHLKHAKNSQGSMDIGQLKSDILKDFGSSLQKLKDNLGNQIEDLITKRSELTEEISNLIQMKDKGFQEYESLTAANTRLSAMNRDLVDNIQTGLKNNKKPGQNLDLPANGLGIYNAQHKGGKSDISVDAQPIAHEHSYANLHENEAEATVAQPQVVNIRKTGKPTKFSTWKKGGQAITKNVTKGFKGAFGSEQKQEEYNVKVIGTPYGSVHQQPDIASMSSSIKSREQDQGTPRGWFGGKPTNARPGQPPGYRPMQLNESSLNLAADATTQLFGSDLSARCEFEKQMIPRIVSRCIEEVELRGMDVEGIYRKSGGTSQVNQVRQGFETDTEHDISDPDLDIHSVTSALKNYFRRLPVPLITYDVYDQFLEAGQLEEPTAQAKALSVAVNEIPKAHRDTLQFLVFHLSRVIQHASDNLMTPLNVAVVFAPTIMRPVDIQRELTDVQQQRVAVQALLENYKIVFGDE
ncbi:rho-type gtpase-activating protein 2 [Stemphylium lycopersici]|uniref:Rho-type gtpase-activating protein 2 n=1 Tax=Stemphylium lycopersici TaxID=183478 RepID=A0A364N9R2_STELY|nr:rho-type gtpase-activating protein 2 [Stemphylium lycopersici]RAR04798.1 rho-type gtpase-activating protein 2 [Stemphylium lycopersici]RAR14084.1 rho-type gtpase-activating protein 2 [Stemphylium lycopersici]